MPAPTFVAATNTTYASRTNTTVNKPSGTVDGDLIVLLFLNGQSGSYGAAPTPPAGFTALPGTPIQVNGWSFYVSTRIYYKVASSEGASWTFTHSAITTQALAVAYRGVDTSTPLDATPTTNNGGGTTRTWTGLTTVTADAMLVALGHDFADTANNLTPPTGMTERLEVNPLVYVAEVVRASPGATGDYSHTINNNSGESKWAAALLALRPGGSSSTTVTPTGLASGQALGSPAISGTVTVSPTGIGSGQAVGTPAVAPAISVTPTGIATGQAPGTPAISGTTSVGPTGLASGQALGAPAISGTVTVSPGGVATGAAVGTPTITTSGTVTPNGIGSGEQLGTPTITTTVTVSPAGVAPGEALGSPTVTMDSTVTPTGIASGAAVGAPSVSTGIVNLDRNLPYSLEISAPVVNLDVAAPQWNLDVEGPGPLGLDVVAPDPIGLTVEAPAPIKLEVSAPVYHLEITT